MDWSEFNEKERWFSRGILVGFCIGIILFTYLTVANKEHDMPRYSYDYVAPLVFCIYDLSSGNLIAELDDSDADEGERRTKEVMEAQAKAMVKGLNEFAQ